MQSKMFFIATNGTSYELEIECEDLQKLPKIIAEDDQGLIVDLTDGKAWNSLAEMTQDLKAEITSWGSDIGD